MTTGPGRPSTKSLVDTFCARALLATMAKVFFFSVLAMHVLMIFLIRERYLLEQTSSEVELLQREAEAI